MENETKALLICLGIIITSVFLFAWGAFEFQEYSCSKSAKILGAETYLYDKWSGCYIKHAGKPYEMLLRIKQR